MNVVLCSQVDFAKMLLISKICVPVYSSPCRNKTRVFSGNGGCIETIFLDEFEHPSDFWATRTTIFAESANIVNGIVNLNGGNLKFFYELFFADIFVVYSDRQVAFVRGEELAEGGTLCPDRIYSVDPEIDADIVELVRIDGHDIGTSEPAIGHVRFTFSAASDDFSWASFITQPLL